MPVKGVSLVFARIYPQKQRMDVKVKDEVAGTHRLIKYRWKTKAANSAPPSYWYEAVKGEVKHQRGRDDARASGRALPFD